MHRIFKKLRHYFPDPLSIRESFREIAARRKRVKKLRLLALAVKGCGATPSHVVALTGTGLDLQSHQWNI